VKIFHEWGGVFSKAAMTHAFSGPANVFHGRRLPETATPAGYAALIDAYGLNVPLPRSLSAIGSRHRVIEEADWHLYTPRHAPAATLEGHLTFAGTRLRGSRNSMAFRSGTTQLT
jgi:hypothetical protein